MSESTAVTEAPEAPKTPVTKEGWKKASIHEGVTLPSGAVVSIRIPNLTAMAKSGLLPNELLDLVVAERAGSDKTPSAEEQIAQQDAFNRYLVSITVVDPVISQEDYDDIPPEDIPMIVQFALRQTDMDAVGHQLGGLEVIPSFRQFRELDRGFADLLG